MLLGQPSLGQDQACCRALLYSEESGKIFLNADGGISLITGCNNTLNRGMKEYPKTRNDSHQRKYLLTVSSLEKAGGSCRGLTDT